MYFALLDLEALTLSHQGEHPRDQQNPLAADPNDEDVGPALASISVRLNRVSIHEATGWMQSLRHSCAHTAHPMQVDSIRTL